MRRWNSMRERVEEYLSTRRSMGYKLKIEGGRLLRFAQFADKDGKPKSLTIDLVTSWANDTPSRMNRARRIEMVRGLAKYCALFEPQTEIPPSRLLGAAHRRVTPYIYSTKEVWDLMQVAAKLNSGKGMRPPTIKCLIGLLSSTGLRIAEALNLSNEDVDFQNALVVVRETKFGKSRYVPLHPTTVVALNDYTRLRKRLMSDAIDNNAFFMLENGPLNYRQALYSFQSIRNQLSWRVNCRSRFHDFRHTFACNRLLAWYAQGIDVNNAIMMLSTYLGHTKVTDTYWYLTGVPALMSAAAERFEHLTGGDP